MRVFYLIFTIVALFVCSIGCESRMGTIEKFSDNVVTLGIASTTNIQYGNKTISKQVFKSIGTGLLIKSDDKDIIFLVTAKHVIESVNEAKLRFSWFSNQAAEDYLGIPIILKEGEKPLYVSHPDDTVDLACISLNIDESDLKRKSIPCVTLMDLVTQDKIKEGDPVIVFGYPDPEMWGGWQYSTKPILRSGIVAWKSPFDVKNGDLLIHSDVLEGDSGGPVIKVLNIPENNSTKPQAIIGIVNKYRITSYSRPILNNSSLSTREIDKLLTRRPVGLVEVTSSGRIIELLEYAKHNLPK